jgi:large subunit ribosomal protein L15
MKLNDLKPARGARKERRRLGRGVGSGRGKTSGRGQKGQKSRSGYSKGQGWEGGRSELIARLPKRGFTGRGPQYQIVNLGDLERFAEGSTVTPEALLEAGLIRNLKKPVKLLGDGELTRNLTVELDACSAAAAEAIRRAGGSVTVLLEPSREQTQDETPAEENG